MYISDRVLLILFAFNGPSRLLLICSWVISQHDVVRNYTSRCLLWLSIHCLPLDPSLVSLFVIQSKPGANNKGDVMQPCLATVIIVRSSQAISDRLHTKFHSASISVRLEDRLQQDIGLPLRRVRLKLGRKWTNLDTIWSSGVHRRDTGGGGWPWQIFGAMRAVATAGEPAKFLFIFC